MGCQPDAGGMYGLAPCILLPGPLLGAGRAQAWRALAWGLALRRRVLGGCGTDCRGLGRAEQGGAGDCKIQRSPRRGLGLNSHGRRGLHWSVVCVRIPLGRFAARTCGHGMRLHNGLNILLLFVRLNLCLWHGPGLVVEEDGGDVEQGHDHWHSTCGLPHLCVLKDGDKNKSGVGDHGGIPFAVLQLQDQLGEPGQADIERPKLNVRFVFEGVAAEA
mmetsp:Transcript_66347/g.110852  ORF Transcript_66347/g.110852 Transcript_66347/m.110852 type:complete len:217 (-) Transcript_66347:595-1245(-)